MKKKNLLFSLGSVGAIAAVPLMALSCTTQEQVKSDALEKTIENCKELLTKLDTYAGASADFQAVIDNANATLEKYKKGEKVNGDAIDAAISSLKDKFAIVLAKSVLGDANLTAKPEDAAKKDNKDYQKLYEKYKKDLGAIKGIAKMANPGAAEYNKLLGAYKGGLKKIQDDFDKAVAEIK